MFLQNYGGRYFNFVYEKGFSSNVFNYFPLSFSLFDYNNLAK